MSCPVFLGISKEKKKQEKDTISRKKTITGKPFLVKIISSQEYLHSEKVHYRVPLVQNIYTFSAFANAVLFAFCTIVAPNISIIKFYHNFSHIVFECSVSRKREIKTEQQSNQQQQQLNSVWKYAQLSIVVVLFLFWFGHFPSDHCQDTGRFLVEQNNQIASVGYLKCSIISELRFGCTGLEIDFSDNGSASNHLIHSPYSFCTSYSRPYRLNE